MPNSMYFAVKTAANVRRFNYSSPLLTPPSIVVAAIDKTGGFAKEGKIPWDIPADLKHFKSVTADCVCVMGRSSYEDICERLGERSIPDVLPGRKSCVVSTTLDPEAVTNATVIRTPGDVYNVPFLVNEPKTVAFIGGHSIFEYGIQMADRIELTIIDEDFECDRRFPIGYLMEHFTPSPSTESPAPNVRFVSWVRTAPQLK